MNCIRNFDRTLGSIWTLLSIGLFCVVGCSTGETRKEYSHEEKARFLVEIANGALVEGDPTGALINLAKAEEEDSSLPELFHTRALAFFAKHDLKKALQSAKKAVKLKPDYSDANNTLGALLIEEGQYQDAILPLTLAAEDSLYRDSFKAFSNLGLLEFRRGNLEKSEAYFSRAIESAPNESCSAWFHRGEIHLRKKEFENAIADYQHATKRQCARTGDAYFKLGVAYQQSRQFGNARKTFIEVQKLFPKTKFADLAMEQLRFLP